MKTPPPGAPPRVRVGSQAARPQGRNGARNGTFATIRTRRRGGNAPNLYAPNNVGSKRRKQTSWRKGRTHTHRYEGDCNRAFSEQQDPQMGLSGGSGSGRWHPGPGPGASAGPQRVPHGGPAGRSESAGHEELASCSRPLTGRGEQGAPTEDTPHGAFRAQRSPDAVHGTPASEAQGADTRSPGAGALSPHPAPRGGPGAARPPHEAREPGREAGVSMGARPPRVAVEFPATAEAEPGAGLPPMGGRVSSSPPRPRGIHLPALLGFQGEGHGRRLTQGHLLAIPKTTAS